MDKKLSFFYSMGALVMLGMAAFTFFSPEDKNPNAIAIPKCRRHLSSTTLIPAPNMHLKRI